MFRNKLFLFVKILINFWIWIQFQTLWFLWIRTNLKSWVRSTTYFHVQKSWLDFSETKAQNELISKSVLKYTNRQLVKAIRELFGPNLPHFLASVPLSESTHTTCQDKLLEIYHYLIYRTNK